MLNKAAFNCQTVVVKKTIPISQIISASGLSNAEIFKGMRDLERKGIVEIEKIDWEKGLIFCKMLEPVACHC